MQPWNCSFGADICEYTVHSKVLPCQSEDSMLTVHWKNEIDTVKNMARKYFIELLGVAK